MTESPSTAMEARVDVVRGAEKRHSMSLAASSVASGGEQWRCTCGAHYKGDGAIERGRRHSALEILIALDSLAVSA